VGCSVPSQCMSSRCGLGPPAEYSVLRRNTVKSWKLRNYELRREGVAIGVGKIVSLVMMMMMMMMMMVVVAVVVVMMMMMVMMMMVMVVMMMVVVWWWW